MAISFLDDISHIDCGSAVLLDNLFDGGGTLSLWFYATDYGPIGGSGFARVLCKEDNGASGWLMFLQEDQSIAFFQTTTAATGAWSTPAGSILLNTWYNITMSYNATTVTTAPQFYVNGDAVVATTILTPSGTRFDDSPQTFRIGNRGDASRRFAGRMADVRVYDRILSSNEASTIYHSRGADSIVQGLIRRYPMNPGIPGRSLGTGYINHSTATAASATSVVVPVPTGITNGDALYMLVMDGGNTSGTAATISTPAGWTGGIQHALPSTATTPAVAIFRRTASSEPANYTVTSDQTSPKAAIIVGYRGITPVTATSTYNSGTSGAPTSGTLSPAQNSLILQVMVHDSTTVVPTPVYTCRPSGFDYTYRDTVVISGGSSNGGSLSFAELNWDNTTTPVGTWSLLATEQWGVVVLAAPSSYDRNTRPIHDLSESAGDSVMIGNMVHIEDNLTIR